MTNVPKHGCSLIGSSNDATGECCRNHDREYAKGEFIAKFVADFVLFYCMITTADKGSNIGATILFFCLRLAGALVIFAAVFTIGWIWWLKYLLRRVSGGKWFPKAEDKDAV